MTCYWCKIFIAHHWSSSIVFFRLFEVTETVSGIYLMMEYAPGGELFVRLAECGSYTENEAKPIFAQIASAVQYMVKVENTGYNKK